LKKLFFAAAFSVFFLHFFSCAGTRLPERAPLSGQTPSSANPQPAPEIIEIVDDADDAGLTGILPEPEMEDKPRIVLLPEERETPYTAPIEVVRAEPEYRAPVPAPNNADRAAPPAEPPQETITVRDVPAPAPPPEPQPPPEPVSPPPAPPRIVRPAQRAPVPQAAEAAPVPRPAVNLPARVHQTETEPKEIDSFSREIRAVTGQFVEVPFWGTGWVFLGETGANRGLSYDSRRLDDDGQTFVFRAQATGEYFLKFSKQDYVSNYYVNDSVKVIIGENINDIPPGYLSAARVSAPRWAPKRGGETTLDAVSAPAPPRAEGAARDDDAGPQPPATGAPAGAPVAASSGLASDDVAPTSEAVTVAPDYLTEARTAFDAKNFGGAIAALDLLRYSSPVLDDEAWWLYGQSFEANSPARDIKSAIDSYQHIIRDFPRSSRYDAAQGRIAYLNKFYFNIR
jgi:hypothetical protein